MKRIPRLADEQANTLRSSEKLLQSQIAILTKSNSDLTSDLNKSRKANDRQRMEHDKAKLEWEELDKLRANGTPGPGKPNGSGNATPNGKVEEVGGSGRAMR
jgi:E3 ubiquitin-protein ligase BRE1